MLQVAITETRQGLAEGGVPIGAALFDRQGNLLGRGHNRRVQETDPSVHAEADAFRKAGRRRSYRDTIMVTTLRRNRACPNQLCCTIKRATSRSSPSIGPTS
jgi:cytosine/creatinine deaminase